MCLCTVSLLIMGVSVDREEEKGRVEGVIQFQVPSFLKFMEEGGKGSSIVITFEDWAGIGPWEHLA